MSSNDTTTINITKSLHRDIALAAWLDQTSIKDWAINALQDALASVPQLEKMRALQDERAEDLREAA